MTMKIILAIVGLLLAVGVFLGYRARTRVDE